MAAYLRRLLVCVLSAALHVPAATGQGLPIEVLMNAESIGVPIDLSPDGAWLAVPIQRPRRGSRESDSTIGTRYDRTIELHDLATRRTMRLDIADPQRELPRWSPKSDRLVFRAGTDQRMHLWLWSRAQQQAARVKDVPLAGPSGLWWLADNRRVLTVVESAADTLVRRRQTQSRSGDKTVDDTDAASVVVYRHDPQQTSAAAIQDFASNDGYLGDLAIVDVESGTVTRLMTAC
jgi:dipeptidyl aminopeptidase/acylaminoacyl peptidase